MVVQGSTGSESVVVVSRLADRRSVLVTVGKSLQIQAVALEASVVRFISISGLGQDAVRAHMLYSAG